MAEPPAANEVTIVTGGSRGIGAAIADRLAAAGHRLVLVARDEAALAAVAAALRARGAQALAVPADLRAPGAVQEIVAAAERSFGPPSVVIDNAGTAPSDKLEHTSDETMRDAFLLHVGAPLALARACVAAMKKARRGCLLHLASTAGLRGYAFTAAYTAAKHGMVGLARALHAELQPAGLHVYALCPGFVDSDITRAAAAAIAARGKTTAADAFARLGAQNRIGRMHTTGEVADAVAWLLRDRPAGCVYDLDRQTPGFVD